MNGFTLIIDHCECVTTTVELQTIPDFTWTHFTTPANYYIDVFYPADPSWAGLDNVNQDTQCFGTIAISGDTKAVLTLYAAEDSTGPPVTQISVPYLVFDDSVSNTSTLTATETYPVVWTVTMTVTTPATWIPSAISGTTVATASQAFKLTINEPCTQYRIPTPGS